MSSTHSNNLDSINIFFRLIYQKNEYKILGHLEYLVSSPGRQGNALRGCVPEEVLGVRDALVQLGDSRILIKSSVEFTGLGSNLAKYVRAFN